LSYGLWATLEQQLEAAAAQAALDKSLKVPSPDTKDSRYYPYVQGNSSLSTVQSGSWLGCRSLPLKGIGGCNANSPEERRCCRSYIPER